MKKLYVMARNHMDPSWLRCFTDHYTDTVTDTVRRPYADIEELQILEYMDFAEKYGVKYHIEQSAVVKKFLERNPDQRERFGRLVRGGFLELAGGGETVIDRNLTCGESWVRDHLYSNEYYKREFDHEPRYAITPDIFGLPSQLPQFFRSIGYDALIVFDRLLLDNKPFWRGLDGSLINLDRRWLQPPEPTLRTADCVRSSPCPLCSGEGCEACEGTGLDLTYNMTRPDKIPDAKNYFGNMTASELLDELEKVEKEEYHVMIVTEEPLIGDNLFGQLNELAPKRGFELCYVTFEENHDIWCPGEVERLRAGEYTEDEIDTRPEGNPASTGDCSSRIEIKKVNARLETLLREAEALAVIARENGGYSENAVPFTPYPEKKIEQLWNKMAFVQFHDCITGTHCDASYDELMRYIREIRRGAEQIYTDAAKEYLRSAVITAPEGKTAAVFFNPSRVPLKLPRISVKLPEGAASAEVFDSRENRLQAFDFIPVKAKTGTALSMRVAAEVPPMGVRAFFVRPKAEVEDISVTTRDTVIENEFLIIRAENGRITEVFDKENDRPLLKGACLQFSEDIGSPWGRGVPEEAAKPLKAATIFKEKKNGCSSLVLRGSFKSGALKISKLDWSLKVTLFDGERLISIDTDIDWNARDKRVYFACEPAFDFGEELICEVPFGTMRRSAIPPGTCCLGICDEWPSLGFAGVEGEGCSAALLKSGLPGTSVRDGALRLALLRSTRGAEPEFDEMYAGVTDSGRHRASFALSVRSEKADAARWAAEALRIGTAGHTEQTCGRGNPPLGSAEKASCVMPEKTGFEFIGSLPENVCLSALKYAQDKTAPVIRLWECAGKKAKIAAPPGAGLIRCDSLEKRRAAPVAEYEMRPFEIATFIIKYQPER